MADLEQFGDGGRNHGHGLGETKKRSDGGGRKQSYKGGEKAWAEPT